MMNEKHDCFVGNLPFTVTEEQLLEHFSLVGPVKKVRMLNDKETGRPKGFAFVEYYEPLVALAAIRHLNNTELGGKSLRVGFSSNSTLRDKAKELGQDIPEGGTTGGNITATNNIIHTLSLAESWDILDSMKKLVEEDRSVARSLLETYPQLVYAFYEIQRKLGVVTTAPASITQQLPPPPPPPPTLSAFPGIIVPDLLAQAPTYYHQSMAIDGQNPIHDGGGYVDPYQQQNMAVDENGNYYQYDNSVYDMDTSSSAYAYQMAPPPPPQLPVVLFNDPPEPPPAPAFSWG